MKTHVLISLLLVCSASAFPLLDDLKEIVQEVLKDLKLYVLDDNEKPVLLDLTDDFNESQEVTKKDLSNRVFFYLYTANTAKAPVKLYVNDVDGLKKSDFNPKRPTKFITHGWINSYKSKACTLIRDAYLKRGDYNIIVIDWGKITSKPYIWASRRVVMVAQFVSTMLNFLQTQGMNPSDVSIVGHSLGAHVAGLSSHYANNKVAAIFALDPALPNFSTAKSGSRVSQGDANYVEVIHSSAGLLGYKTAIGDSDFYPNGGSAQPGCIIDIGGACSHPRSYKYFAESVSSKGFLGVECESYQDFVANKCSSNPTAVMGDAPGKAKSKGIYYLDTNLKNPYALGTAKPRKST